MRVPIKVCKYVMLSIFHIRHLHYACSRFIDAQRLASAGARGTQSNQVKPASRAPLDAFVGRLGYIIPNSVVGLVPVPSYTSY